VRLEIHADKCTGCHICQGFCSFHHEEAVWLRRSRVALAAPCDEGPFTPIICRQCDDAPCAAACPTGAIAQEQSTGAWLVDREVCAGCGDCAAACPYDAIWVDEELGIALKCDLCGGEPECAPMCPPGAIVLESEG
jgi:carbon-monoxide dehydrogenase iron sulfur subunit